MRVMSQAYDSTDVRRHYEVTINTSILIYSDLFISDQVKAITRPRRREVQLCSDDGVGECICRVEVWFERTKVSEGVNLLLMDPVLPPGGRGREKSSTIQPGVRVVGVI